MSALVLSGSSISSTSNRMLARILLTELPTWSFVSSARESRARWIRKSLIPTQDLNGKQSVLVLSWWRLVRTTLFPRPDHWCSLCRRPAHWSRGVTVLVCRFTKTNYKLSRSGCEGRRQWPLARRLGRSFGGGSFIKLHGSLWAMWILKKLQETRDPKMWGTEAAMRRTAAVLTGQFEWIRWIESRTGRFLASIFIRQLRFETQICELMSVSLKRNCSESKRSWLRSGEGGLVLRSPGVCMTTSSQTQVCVSCIGHTAQREAGLQCTVTSGSIWTRQSWSRCRFNSCSWTYRCWEFMFALGKYLLKWDQMSECPRFVHAYVTSVTVPECIWTIPNLLEVNGPNTSGSGKTRASGLS